MTIFTRAAGVIRDLKEVGMIRDTDLEEFLIFEDGFYLQIKLTEGIASKRTGNAECIKNAFRMEFSKEKIHTLADSKGKVVCEIHLK